MRVITLNVNGIRSAAKKGLFEWLARQNADVVCLQEVKAQQADLTDQMLAPKGFHGFFNCAEKKGYAGVALYSRRKPDGLRWSSPSGIQISLHGTLLPGAEETPRRWARVYSVRRLEHRAQGNRFEELEIESE